MANAGAQNYVEAFYDSFGRKIGRGVGVMIPAKVVKYDRDTHAVHVQPLVALNDEFGYVADGVVVCTVWRPYGGKFLIDMPLDVGDTGWVISADSNTDNVKENCVFNHDGKEPEVWNPRTDHEHLFQYGMFLPDRWGGKYNTDANHVTDFEKTDNGHLVIQSEDGKQKLSIGTTGTSFDVTITAGSSVTINAPIATVNTQMATVTSNSVDVTASSGMTIDAPDVIFKHSISPANGANGTFTGSNFVTVTNGIVTNIA